MDGLSRKGCADTTCGAVEGCLARQTPAIHLDDFADRRANTPAGAARSKAQAKKRLKNGKP